MEIPTLKLILHINSYSYTSDDKVKGYIIHGATVSEVEVDVLTGEKLVRISPQFFSANLRN